MMSIISRKPMSNPCSWTITDTLRSDNSILYLNTTRMQQLYFTVDKVLTTDVKKQIASRHVG